MLLKKIKLLIAAASLLTFTTACGQGQQFQQSDNNDSSLQSLDEDFTNRTDLSEEELVDLVGQEQILLMDENQVTLNDETDDGLAPDSCDDESCNGHGSISHDPGGTGGLSINGLLGGILGGHSHEHSESGNGGRCGDRSSHTIQIHGPHGSYVGVGPGNVEVSTDHALVCVAPDEIIVAVGDIEGDLLDAAACHDNGEAQQIRVCHKQNGGPSYESCISKDQLYVSVRRQQAQDKTYLGACQ